MQLLLRFARPSIYLPHGQRTDRASQPPVHRVARRCDGERAFPGRWDGFCEQTRAHEHEHKTDPAGTPILQHSRTHRRRSHLPGDDRRIVHSRTIVKTLDSLIGYITRVAVSGPSCEFSGGADQLTILGNPWHIKYEGFFGGLPTIARLHVGFVLVAFLIRILGGLINCLWRNEPATPLRSWFERNTTTGQLTRFEFTGASIRLVSGSPDCWDAHLQGTGGVRLLGTSTTLIFLALI